MADSPCLLWAYASSGCCVLLDLLPPSAPLPQCGIGTALFSGHVLLGNTNHLHPQVSTSDKQIGHAILLDPSLMD